MLWSLNLFVECIYNTAAIHVEVTEDKNLHSVKEDKVGWTNNQCVDQ